jgi:hypothetical protein
MVIAAVRYPGGTWCDPRAPGYQLLESFFCDVLHERGLNGSPNPGAPWARAALVSIGLGFAPFWWSIPWTMGLTPRRGSLVRVLGVASALASVAVALAPSDRMPWLHQIAVLTASGAGVAAAVLASTSRTRGHGSRALRLVAWGALLTAALDAGLYLVQVLEPQPCGIALPALQKLAAAFILTWMLGNALILLRAQPAS